MKYLIFVLVMLCSSMCYGQTLMSKDKVFILITDRRDSSLSRDAEKQFADPAVRAHFGAKQIQFVQLYGQDLDADLHTQWKVTHYPAVVYLMKQDGKYVLSKTVSGIQRSKYLAQTTQIRSLLGMKAKTYLENNPLIPGSKPPTQYVSPPQRSVAPPQQFIRQPQQYYQPPTQSYGSS